MLCSPRVDFFDARRLARVVLHDFAGAVLCGGAVQKEAAGRRRRATREELRSIAAVPGRSALRRAPLRSLPGMQLCHGDVCALESGDVFPLV
jgi:hypothetical protein